MKEEITYKEAEELASKISSSATKIKDILDNSDQVVKKIQTNWKGVSADSAQANWDSWKKDFEEYYNLLMLNVTNIKSAAEKFAATEAAIQKDFD